MQLLFAAYVELSTAALVECCVQIWSSDECRNTLYLDVQYMHNIDWTPYDGWTKLVGQTVNIPKNYELGRFPTA